MAIASMPAASRPMAELNTTPLIDVLLVLLILFIMTVPVATHSLEVQIGACDSGCPPIQRDSNDLTITAGDHLLWNGTQVQLNQLDPLLAATRAMKPEPELRFAPDGSASYAATIEAMNHIKAADISAFGFVGNERFASFAKTN